jgi:hypothetical protein
VPLTMRPTGLASPAYQDRQDWTIHDDGQPVGRIYEDASAGTPAEQRWFWSVTVYVDPKSSIITSGKVPTLDEAKAQFETAWRRWLAWANLQKGRRSSRR